MDEATAGSGGGVAVARAAGILLMLILGALFVYANRGEVPNAWRAARTADALYLGIAALVTVAFFVNLSALHAAAYRAVGLRMPFREMAWLTLASAFVNMVAKSGGMGGLTLFLADARRRQQPAGRVVTAYLLANLLGHLAFAVTLAIAMVVVWRGGQLTRPEVLAGGVFTAYFVVQVVVFIAGVRSRAALRMVHALPARLAHGVKRIARRGSSHSAPDNRAADELFDAISLLIRRPSAMILPAAHAVAVELLGVATVAAVLRAFGEGGGLQTPLVAYAIAVLFSIVGFLPAGLGFVEASMVATLTAFGVAAPVAAVTVLTYRLFEVWIPFVAGAIAAQALARKKETK